MMGMRFVREEGYSTVQQARGIRLCVWLGQRGVQEKGGRGATGERGRVRGWTAGMATCEAESVEVGIVEGLGRVVVVCDVTRLWYGPRIRQGVAYGLVAGECRKVNAGRSGERSGAGWVAKHVGYG